MTTNEPTPPPGMRLLTAEELTKPLPMDAMLWDDLGKRWIKSRNRGEARRPLLTYATATPPPTDWRKLVEELVNALEKLKSHKVTLFDDGVSADLHEVGITTITEAYARGLSDGFDELKDIIPSKLLTRAKAALEESK